MPPSEYVGAVPLRLDVTGDGAGLPTLSIISEIVVDQSFNILDADFLSISYDGERITIDAPEDYTGPIVITYTAEDEKGGTSEDDAFIIFNVRPAGELPDPRDDIFDLFEDGERTFAITDLLANDRDDDGDAMRVVMLEAPANGALTINLAEQTIAPPAAISPLAGSVWTATLSDGSDLPDWMALNSATGEIIATVPLGVLSDLAITFTNSDGTSSNSATQTSTFDGNAGATATYTPDASFSGLDALTYSITDDAEGTGTAAATIQCPAFVRSTFGHHR